jgi:hypothetical protein
MVDILVYASTNVPTTGYVTLDASLSSSYGHIQIVDTSTQLMKLAIGPAGSEIDLCVFQGNGYPVLINVYLIAGIRLSVRAVSAEATTGYLAVSYLA